jgi:tetratricopeptide (TPR) repeat protein
MPSTNHKNYLEQFVASLKQSTAVDHTPTEILDLVKPDALESKDLLKALGNQPEAVYTLIDLVIAQEKLDDWWGVITDLLDAHTEDEKVSDLKNAILDLWLSPEDANSYTNLGAAWAGLDFPQRAQFAYSRAEQIGPDNPNDRGVLHYNQGRYQEALIEYDRALAIFPDDTVALKNKALALGDINEYQGLLPVLDHLIRLTPEDVWAIHERGRVYTELENYEAALEDYDRVIQLDSTYIWAFANKGKSLAQLNRFEEAEEAFAQALKLDRNYTWVYQERAFMRRNLDQCDLALTDYNHVLRLDPANKWAQVYRADCLRRLNRFAESKKAFTQLLNEHPDFTYAHNEFGLFYNELEQYDLAMAEFQKAAAQDNNYKWAYHNIGVAHHNLGQYTEALAALDKAIQIDPTYVSAIHEKGRVLVSLEEYEKAIREFERVIALDPDYKWAFANKAHSLRKLNRLNESKQILSKLLAKHPDYVWARNEFGLVYEEMGEYKRAIREFKRAVVADKKYKYPYANIGNNLRKFQRYEEAIKYFDQAIDLDRNYTWAIHQRGLSYFDLARHEEAITDFDRVIALDPEYKWAYANKGKSSRILNRYPEAVRAFNKALRLDPQYAWVYSERGELYLLDEQYHKAESDFRKAIEYTTENTATGFEDRAWYHKQLGKIYEQTGNDKKQYQALLKALVAYDQATQLNPSEPNNFWNQGVVWQDLYAYDKAIESYQKALGLLKPESHYDASVLSWNIAKCHHEWAVISAERERYELACQDYELAEAGLTEVELAECLGEHAEARFEHDQPAAAQIIERAHQLDPHNALHLKLMGKYNLALKRHPQAQHAFEQILALHPPSGENASAYAGLALLSERQNNLKQAQKFHHQALLDKSAEEYRKRADIYADFFELDKAEQDYQQAVNLAPDDPGLKNILAWFLVTKKPTPANLARAVELSLFAVDRARSGHWKANYMDTLGWIYYHLGDFHQARQYLQKALKIYPDSLEMRHHLDLANKALERKHLPASQARR